MDDSSMREKDKWKNVAIATEDHFMLKSLADREHRSMARQLAWMIRKEFDEGKENVTINRQ